MRTIVLASLFAVALTGCLAATGDDEAGAAGQDDGITNTAQEPLMSTVREVPDCPKGTQPCCPNGGPACQCIPDLNTCSGGSLKLYW